MDETGKTIMTEIEAAGQSVQQQCRELTVQTWEGEASGWCGGRSGPGQAGCVSHLRGFYDQTLQCQDNWLSTVKPDTPPLSPATA